MKTKQEVIEDLSKSLSFYDMCRLIEYTDFVDDLTPLNEEQVRKYEQIRVAPLYLPKGALSLEKYELLEKSKISLSDVLDYYPGV